MKPITYTVQYSNEAGDRHSMIRFSDKAYCASSINFRLMSDKFTENLPQGERSCYVPASIAFWGQKAGCWDNPKPLKVSGIFIPDESVFGDQTRCLLV